MPKHAGRIQIKTTTLQVSMQKSKNVTTYTFTLTNLKAQMIEFEKSLQKEIEKKLVSERERSGKEKWRKIRDINERRKEGRSDRQRRSTTYVYSFGRLTWPFFPNSKSSRGFHWEG